MPSSSSYRASHSRQRSWDRRDASRIVSAHTPQSTPLRGRRKFEADVKAVADILGSNIPLLSNDDAPSASLSSLCLATTPFPSFSAASLSQIHTLLYLAICEGPPPIDWITWALTFILPASLPISALLRQVCETGC
jgi:hypothetical protein